jgi:hypothetical protein
MKMRTKTSHQSQIVWQNNEPVVEEVEIVKTYDEVTREWLTEKKKPIYKPLSEGRPELQKESTFQVLEMRQAVNTYSLLPLSAYFVREITVKIPVLKQYKHVYFVKVRNEVIINDLNGLAQSVSLTEIFSGKSDFVLKMSNPRKVSVAEASRLQKQGVKVVRFQGSEPVIML